jgi:hypothetical protein
MAPDLSPSEIRSILLEQRYLAPVAAVCKKWGITASRLRTWKREHGAVSGSLRELVIVALQSSTVGDPAELVSFLDMQDHCIYTPAEIAAVLDGLVAEGKVLKRDGVWSYDQARLARERPFIF